MLAPPARGRGAMPGAMSFQALEAVSKSDSPARQHSWVSHMQASTSHLPVTDLAAGISHDTCCRDVEQSQSQPLNACNACESPVA